MIHHLPDRLDLIATAEAGRLLRGSIAVRKLKRLTPALLSDEGELSVEMELGKGADGTRYLNGTINGAVALTCQRCLRRMMLPLDLSFRLGLAQSEAAVSALPTYYEPLLVTAEPARMAELIADEVLLAIPIVPSHGNDEHCHEFVEEYKPPEDDKRENPFAVLADLELKQ